MNKHIKNSLIILIFLFISCTPEVSVDTGDNLKISTPEAEGIASRAILSFVEAAEKEQPDALHSMMLLRHGKIVAQGWWSPYGPDIPHMLYSLSKSFTSTAIGFAAQEGKLSITDPVISFFPDEIPSEPGDNLKAMRIKDLLRMNTGHQEDATGRIRTGENWVKAFLALPVEHKPGTHFVYNSAATYMLSAIIQKVTGMTLLEYLKPRLFEPLGIKNPTWESDPQGINFGGWGLSITTEDIAKLGQLYLQKGVWKGEQLLSEEWVNEATSLQTSNGSNPDSDWEQGYGYQFWRCRHNFYRGDGAFGQFCIVMPDHDAVLAITAGSRDMQGIMNLAWKFLLPAMQTDPLPPDEEGYALLQGKLAGLTISPVEGEADSPLADEISGKSFVFETNDIGLESAAFNLDKTSRSITVKTTKESQKVEIGYGKMLKGAMSIPGIASNAVAVSGAWTDTDTYVTQICFYETPHMVRYSFGFDKDQVIMETEFNVFSGSSSQRKLTGILSDEQFIDQ